MTKKLKVFIDCGHGGEDPGAVNGSLHEANVVLSIGLRVQKLLEGYENVEVMLSRTTDKTLSLKQRTDAANAWGADILISIHINAGGGVGFESFVYNGGAGSATVALQNVLHNAIMKHCSFFKDRGKKQANFHMVRESKMKAVLTECGFIDNAGDAANLKKEEVLDQIALGHVEGIADFTGIQKKVVKAAAPKQQVRLIIETNDANAKGIAEDFKKRGYSVKIESIK